LICMVQAVCRRPCLCQIHFICCCCCCYFHQQNTITDRQRLTAELENVQHNGFAD